MQGEVDREGFGFHEGRKGYDDFGHVFSPVVHIRGSA